MKLQNDIDRLEAWAGKYGMRFQSVKSNIGTDKQFNAEYTLDGSTVQNVDKIKHIRVTIMEDLRWNTHVSNLFTKANKTPGFLSPVSKT